MESKTRKVLFLFRPRFAAAMPDIFMPEASAAAAGDLRFRIADGFYRRYFGGDSAGLEVLMRTVISAKSVLPMKIRGFAEVS